MVHIHLYPRDLLTQINSGIPDALLAARSGLPALGHCLLARRWPQESKHSVLTSRRRFRNIVSFCCLVHRCCWPARVEQELLQVAIVSATLIPFTDR